MEMLSELNLVTAFPILLNHLFCLCLFFFTIQEQKYIISLRPLICFISFHFYMFSKHKHVHTAHYFQKFETYKPVLYIMKYKSKIISCIFLHAFCIFFLIYCYPVKNKTSLTLHLKLIPREQMQCIAKYSQFSCYRTCRILMWLDKKCLFLATFYSNKINSVEVNKPSVLSLGIKKTQWFEEIKARVSLGIFLPKICFMYEPNFPLFFCYLRNQTVYRHKGWCKELVMCVNINDLCS